jgi:glycogen operon protein
MKKGQPYPLGTTCTAEGVNFSVFSSHARLVHLLLFDHDKAAASRSIELCPSSHRTGHYWHVEVPDIQPGQHYAYRVEGPFSPEVGYRFDSEKVLLDPYGRAVYSQRYDRSAAIYPGDNQALAMRSIVVNAQRYDWEGDRPLGLPFRETVIYELHVAGFTRHPSSGVAEHKRGTYAGLVEKIPYLQELGITAVELMPVFQFDTQDAPPGRENYWGYSPVSLFAPHLGYSSSGDPLECLDEFRDMVKALHRAGIEVILDVVYNHTAEGGANGPTLSFKGLDNSLYYTLTGDRRNYADFTGTGNTLNANQSVVRRIIMDSLRYWVAEMHVDGFRFDLASVLSRNESGRPVTSSPVVWDIDSDPVLAGTKLMAEAWDAGGLYEVGSFSKDRWTEWNGHFRDDIRSFIKSDRGTVPNLRQRLLGSPDLYPPKSSPPQQSINFVTCHDGFTLNDLVSYNVKHNENNGEGNRDGMSENLSWNCGQEGPTQNAEIETLRERQIKNAFTLNLLSIGTPLLLMGDEVRRTQRGNNNAYCQNNELSWFDWRLCSQNAGLHRFVSLLIRMRRHFGSNFPDRSDSLRQLLDWAHVEWHGVKLYTPDLSDDSHTIAATAYVRQTAAFHVMMNAYWEPLQFDLPPETPEGKWFRIVDTSQPSPLDLRVDADEIVAGPTYVLRPRSIVLLGSLQNKGKFE